jgi:predicted RNase H-like nuclease (RuvC/YqgF family)
MLRANIKALADQLKESQREVQRLSNECTRLDEKSKGHDRSYEQLLDAIRDLGRKLDRFLGVRDDE